MFSLCISGGLEWWGGGDGVLGLEEALGGGGWEVLKGMGWKWRLVGEDCSDRIP